MLLHNLGEKFIAASTTLCNECQSSSAQVGHVYSASAYGAHQRIELLRRETPVFILSDLGRKASTVDCRISGVMQGRLYQIPVGGMADLKQRLIGSR